MGRRACPTRPTTARPVACSTCPSRPSAFVNKRVRGKILPKRIYVRVEHVKHSQCRQEFLDRVQSNDEKKKAANEAGKRINLKREPRQPRTAHTVSAKDNVPQLITPIPYEFIC